VHNVRKNLTHKEYNMHVVEEHYGNRKYKCGHREEIIVLPLPVMFINNMHFGFFVRQKFSQTLCTLIIVRRSFFLHMFFVFVRPTKNITKLYTFNPKIEKKLSINENVLTQNTQ
jgi:hypothetical protein